MNKFLEWNLQKEKKITDKWYEYAAAKFPLAQDVKIIQDIPYLEDGLDCHKTDIYYPQEHTGKLPVIFDFHGGGLLLCDRKINRWFCSSMAQRGFLVFCIDYPLVPESNIYDILRDCYAGIREAYEMIENYGGNKNKIFLCGDSAGAFISTYLAAIHNNPQIAASLEIKPFDCEIKALAAISGMFYTSRIDRQGIFILRKYFYGESYKKHPFWPYVNPENEEVLKHLPPMYCVTSKGDYLREYTLRFVRALKNNGKEVVLQDYAHNPKLIHDFVCMQLDREETQETMDEIAKFFIN